MTPAGVAAFYEAKKKVEALRKAGITEVRGTYAALHGVGVDDLTKAVLAMSKAQMVDACAQKMQENATKVAAVA